MQRSNINHALIAAVVNNDCESIRAFVAQGADINFMERTRAGDQRTALMYAILHGHEDVAHLLLDLGADTEGVSSHTGLTALKMAIDYNHTEMALLLLARGAGVNPKSGSFLHTAIHSNNHIIVQALLNAGAEVNAYSLLDRSPRRGFHDHPFVTPLTQALVEIVCPIFCKSSRFEIEQTGFYRKSEAISWWDGYMPLASLLLQRGADVNAAAPEEMSFTSWNTLAYAVECRDIPMIQAALDWGAWIDPRDKRLQETLLHASRQVKEVIWQAQGKSCR